MARPGRPIGWRVGNQTLGLMHGRAADHDEPRKTVDRVTRTFAATRRNVH